MKSFITILITCVAVLLFIASDLAAQDDSLDVEKIIKEVDELYRSKSSHGIMEMEIVTPHYERTLRMEVWTRTMKKTLIRIKAPKKDEGVGTLRIEDEMWNYLPKTNKVIKIPPSMMMSSWMGSDFTNDDLVKEFSLFEDYKYEKTTVENPDTNFIYINCIPREDLPIVWGNIVIAARRDGYIPVWQKYYDEKGKLMRVLEYSNVKTFDGRTIPSEMTMKPQNEEGHTTIRYIDIEFNVDLSDDIFSLRNLRSY